MTKPDAARTYGNMTSASAVTGAAAAYPEYPTGDLPGLNYYQPRPYPTQTTLTYLEFTKCLGRYAWFSECYGEAQHESNPTYKAAYTKYAKYAEYATYRLLQSFAHQFNLPVLEAACTDMQTAVLASPGEVKITLDATTLEALRQEYKTYSEKAMEPITASKSGYSLSSFRALIGGPGYNDPSDYLRCTANVSYNWKDSYNASQFTVSYLPLAPVFRRVDSKYCKVGDLREHMLLPSGSLVYAESTADKKDRSARFFIKGSYDGGNNNAAHFIDEKGFVDTSPFDYNNLSTYNSPAITRVPSQYRTAPGADPTDVDCWEVISIIPPDSDSNNPHPFYNYGTYGYQWYWHGDAYSEDNGTKPIKIADLIQSGTYINSNHVMVELAPYNGTVVTVPEPKISLENISLKLEKNGNPTVTNGTMANLTEDNYYLAFYVEQLASAGADWDDTKATKTYSGGWSEKERVLYPGDWRVFCRAVYRHTDGTLYHSDTATKDIHITEPQLSPPSITINGMTATYARPTSIAAKAASVPASTLKNDSGSYTPYIQDQQLIRKTTQNPADTTQSLGLPAGALGEAADFGVQDTLALGYNKIFAYTVLTLPEENRIGATVPAKADRSYYSGDKTEEKTLEQASVSFDTQGGVFDANGTGYRENDNPLTVGSPYGVNGKLPKASKAQYTFQGWYTQVSGGDKITAQTIVNTPGPRTLYAVWKKKTANPSDPPTPPDQPAPPPSVQETQVSWNALSHPVQTVQRVIENVKTGDSRPYWKWGILLAIGILTTLYPILDAIHSHFRHKRRKMG